jgi:hypothetical protein
MTSGTDDKALRAQSRSGMERTRNNVVTLIPKARTETAAKKRTTELPVPDQKVDPPRHDGDDDPGPSAA